MNELDYTELTDFTKDLLKLASSKLPKERDKFLRREGNKLKAEVKAEFKNTTKKRTGNLLKGITRGRPYSYAVDSRDIRVYPTAPAYHAHLVDKGHNIVTHKGETRGRAYGVDAMETARERFDDRFETDCSDWIDDLLREGLL